jgi:hypothetical protein
VVIFRQRMVMVHPMVDNPIAPESSIRHFCRA